MALIELTGIAHSYGTVQAIQELTLKLSPGPIGLIGQNGAGKSTLLKILLGMLRPSSGCGTVLGYDLQRQTSSLRLHVGFMPEAEAILPGIRGVDLVGLAGELSGMPRQQARRRAHEVLSYLELEEARYRPCEQYSVGMKQRLKLACALVHDPQLLLLDEPTAGLDPQGRDAMLALLQAIAERHGKSLILSTHLLGDIERICQQVVILDRGRLIGVGPLANLYRSTIGRYRLRWTGDATEFLAGLARSGVRVPNGPKPDQAVVDVPSGWTPRRFFEESAKTAIVLREVSPEAEDLQQMYHRLISEPAIAAKHPGGTRVDA